MITVEELIIQSLYHRMVVVNVRRTPTVTPTGGRVDALGLLISGAQRMRSAMTAQGQIQAGQGQGPAESASAEPSSVRSTGTQGEDEGQEEGEGKGKNAEEEGSVVKVKSRQGTVDFSEGVQTILDTGEIKLVKAMSKTTETQTDFSPVWFFGFDPTANQPTATVTTPDGTVVAADEPAVRDIPAVDLSRFDQFSVIHYSDTRDPDNRKLVMIQTPGSRMYKPEELCSEDMSVQNKPSLDIPQSSKRHMFDRKTKSLDNSLLTRPHDTGEARGHDSVLKRQERVGEGKPESGDEASHDGDVSLQDPDIDSGIWDMVHGRDARLSSRDVVTPMTSPKVSKGATGRRHDEEGDAGRDHVIDDVRGAEGGEERTDNLDESASTWQDVYEQMGMGLPDGDRPTMSYRVFHIEDQVGALEGETTEEPMRLESPLSNRSPGPTPVNASTPQAKIKVNNEELLPEQIAPFREDHDSDLGTELRSNDSRAEDVFNDEVFPTSSSDTVEDSGWLFDKIPAMQGSLIHSPSSPSSPNPFPQFPVCEEDNSSTDAQLGDDDNDDDDDTPTDNENVIVVQKTVHLERTPAVESDATDRLAPSHPELPTRDSLESTETVTEERLDDLIAQVEEVVVDVVEDLPVDAAGPSIEEDHERSMTESEVTPAESSSFDGALFDDQDVSVEDEEPAVVVQAVQTEQKSLEMSSPSSGTAEEVSVVEVSQATTASNGDVYESCDEGGTPDSGLMTMEMVVTETVTTETVTTTTTSTPESSRPGSRQGMGDTFKKATPVGVTRRRSSANRPSPLQSPTTPSSQLHSPHSKPTSPLARTFAASTSSSVASELGAERGCVVHRSGARPKLSAMSPRRRQQPMGLQSLFSDEPGTLINGHAERRAGGSHGADDVYLLKRDGTLTSANATSGGGGVAMRSGARPKSTSMSSAPGRGGDFGLSGLNSLMVRSTSSSVVHSHVITELTAARSRLNVPELRRTPDRHSVASSDSEYASVDSSLATSPTSTSVEELASVGSDTCLLAEVMPVANYPDWMENLPKRLHAVPLTQLAIPGSNISFAIESEMRTDMSFSKCNLEMAEFLRKLPPLAVFDNFRKIMKDIWRAWMPKQILSVAKQLEAGVRYLDIHITRYRGTFYGEHGLYTRSLKHYLRHVDEFVQQHPKEVIILHFQKLINLTPKDKRSLVTLLFQFFGAKLCRVMDTENLTLEELWASKKQIIAVFPDADTPALANHIFAGLIWSSKAIRSSLPRKQTTEELVTYLESVYDEQREVGEFHVLQAVVSPDMSMVFGDYLHKSMRSLTLYETSPYLKVWLPGKQHLNIVTVDFVGIYDLTGEIIRLNEGKKAVTNV